MEKNVASCSSDVDRLLSLVETLRSDRGCPWDRVQTPETIKVYLIEEAYEVLEAIESGTHKDVCAELGDLLFQVVFLVTLFEEAGAFNAKDVIQGVTEKMIQRHPHVFGGVRVSSAREVRERWHETKMAEAKANDKTESNLLDSVPQKLPALMRAYRLGQRAASNGFDWPDVQSVLMRIEEDLAEIRAALKSDDNEKSAEVFGDLLFTMVNLGRLIGAHPETVLSKSISRFVKRLNVVQQTLKEQGRTIESISPEEMAAIWEGHKRDTVHS